jgi:RNA polymerase sigma-70 factor (ECF subfamily)
MIGSCERLAPIAFSRVKPSAESLESQAYATASPSWGRERAMETGQSTAVANLLLRAQLGDPVAQNRLFELSRRYLVRLARVKLRRQLQSKVDASDVVQKALLEAHQGLKDFRGKTRQEWLAWLRRILEHNQADVVREYCATDKRRVSREVPLQAGSESGPLIGQLPDSGETPSNAVIRQETAGLIAEALAKLSPDHREVIRLRNLERLPFDQVAERMGRSRPAAQMLWMRAIEKLQQEIAPRLG